MQTRPPRAAVLALSGLLAAGCGRGGVAAVDDPGDVALRAQQAELTSQALRSLASRTIQDERASAASLLTATGVRYDQYDDPDGTVRSALRAVGLPVTVVFDPRGREVARRFGEIKGGWLDDALRKAGAPVPAAG